MPVKSEPATPPPRIGKIGPYTVFVTPNTAAQPPLPAVMAPPAQFHKEKPSSFAFFRDAVAKVQNAHASLDEHVAHWFGLNQSKYQWALDDYLESNAKNRSEAKPSKLQNV